MRKITIILAMLLMFTACGNKETSSQEGSIPEAASQASVTASDTASSDAEAAASEKAASEAAASEAAEKAASEAAASEAAAKAASEAAASEAAAKAASEAAASEAAAIAASQAAASEAAAIAASQAAASEAAAIAASQAAASEAAAQKAVSETSAMKASDTKTASSKTTTKKVTGTNFLSKVETKVLDLQNQEREELGLQPLVFDAELQSAARIRSRELYKNDMFAHTRPDGTDWSTVIKVDVPYTYHSAGENLCTTEYGAAYEDMAQDAHFWVEQWMNSPTHYENMTRTEFNRAGVGIYSITKDGVTTAYATTIYADVEE